MTRWSRISGLTRDRKYGRAGGKAANSSVLIPAVSTVAEEGVETRMAEQSLLAIEEADVVRRCLWLMRAGLMPADSAIAKHLRSREKPTFAVANKTDGIDVDQAMADFWSLGLGDIYPIAASHGRGVTSLLEHVLLPWVDEVNPQKKWMKTPPTGRSLKPSKTAKNEELEEPEDDFNLQICRLSWRSSAVERR